MLNEALVALQARVSVLRNDAIVATLKTTESVQSVVNEIADTGADVASNTQSTLTKVQILQEQTNDMRFRTEQSNARLCSVTEGIKSFTVRQEAMDVKIDDAQTAHQTTHVKIDDVRAVQQITHVKIDDLHGVQQATHRRVETMSDVQEAKDQAAKAKDQAARAMIMAFENAECM